MLDANNVDWTRVLSGSYLIHHQLRYEYPSPIEDLDHRLVVFPPRNHGDQRRITYRLEVSNAPFRESARRDAFGNTVVDLAVARVETHIDFEAWMVVERRADAGAHRVNGAWLIDPRFLEPSQLTSPDERLLMVAASLGRGRPREVAERINAWVHENMIYSPGATDVHTTAAEALAGRHGVCQDYAHVMIALCRLAGLPARYVSGHLVGEGAMHAWVEVLVPCEQGGGDGFALALDPTHGRYASINYVTVAVGRDFADVSPTRGSFRAVAPGALTAGQSVVINDVQYREGAAAH